ncbi:cytochrome P450 [Nocardia blacklockiae]|uniref:cytochrome P450 n=1 Tax=Nocardia blacklockiae TaxID=480036 RepID=UPI001895E0F0|nr:cytochrome P450 [Nocardia blacklockiae]MBF6171072.1 cytochrome P450 [Nocardia blacklockiae]
MQNTTPAPAVRPELEYRYPLYTPEFAQNPHAVYTDMRREFGPLAPVELAPGVDATLVIGYNLAVEILGDPDRFPADPRRWQHTLPDDCPIKPMVEWRPNALRSTGLAHALYRGATTSALDAVDQYGLTKMVIAATERQISTFCRAGTADLISDYALPVVFLTLNRLLGCPDDIGEQVRIAMAAMFESTDTARVNEMLGTALGELIALKRRHPGTDITSTLIAHEPALTTEEIIHQLVTLYGAGIEPTTNLIANTALLILTDHRFACRADGVAPPVADAMQQILVTDPPMANYCLTFPRQPVPKAGIWLPADKPVVISLAACNNDPEVNNGDFFHAAWALPFSTGPHACPQAARDAARQIGDIATRYLFDALPELSLAVPATELIWRPGPFHRALTALPVTFPPSEPLPATYPEEHA